jgi:hypothetical protein
MNRLCIPIAAALAIFVGCQENSSDTTTTSSSSTTAVKTDAAQAPKGESVTAKSSTGAPKPIDYQEVRVGDKLYVVGSKEAAEKAKAGKLEKPARGIGFGPEGVKVYFEEANQAALEAEYAKRHPQ